MPYKLPKELTEAEWKKHKAALATDTGISGKLRELKGVADRYDDTDEKNKALTAALKDFAQDAKEAAKALSGAFAKTKTFLETMSKVANATIHVVHKEMTDRWEEEIRAEKNRKAKERFDAMEAIMAASEKDYAAFTKALANEGQIVGVKVGDRIKFETAMKDGKLGDAQSILKERDVDVKLGPLMKLAKTMPQK